MRHPDKDRVRLSVLSTALSAYEEVFRSPRVLTKAAGIPLLLLVTLLAIGPFVRVSIPELDLVISASVVLPYALFALFWSRIIVSGSDVVSSLIVRHVGRSFLFVLAWGLVYTLVAVPFDWIWPGVFYFVKFWLEGNFSGVRTSPELLAVAYLLQVLSYGILLVLLSRLSPVLPGLIEISSVTPRSAWRITHGNGARICAAAILAAAPFILLHSFNTVVLAEAALRWKEILVEAAGVEAAFAYVLGIRLLLHHIIPLAAVAVVMTLLVSSYRRLKTKDNILARFD